MWKSEIEKLLMDHMPYAFPDFTGARGKIDMEAFAEAVGYVHEFMWVKLKAAYMHAYAQGLVDKTLDTMPITDLKDLSRFPAERAWMKSEFARNA